MRKIWTHDEIRQEALKHKTLGDFSRFASGAYQAAVRLKIKDEVCAHMQKRASCNKLPNFDTSKPFTCSKCGKERCGKFYKIGKSKPVCGACKAHKDAKRLGTSFSEAESGFLMRNYREAISDIGLHVCQSCGEHRTSPEMSNGMSWCKKCRIQAKNKSRKKNGREKWNRQNKANKDSHVKLWASRKKGRNFDAHVKTFIGWSRNAPLDQRGDHWQRAGMPWRDPRLSDSEKYKALYNGNPKFALKERMRRQLNKAKKRDGIGDCIRVAINNNGKSNRVERELGYTIEELCTHLERQFIKGMSWDALKAGDIHIDHIVPQRAFNLQDDEEWKACWSLTNLRPCWAKENLRKSGNREFLL